MMWFDDDGMPLGEEASSAAADEAAGDGARLKASPLQRRVSDTRIVSSERSESPTSSFSRAFSGSRGGGGVVGFGAADLERRLEEMSEAQAAFRAEVRGEMREMRSQLAGLQALFASLAGASPAGSMAGGALAARPPPGPAQPLAHGEDGGAEEHSRQGTLTRSSTPRSSVLRNLGARLSPRRGRGVD